MRFEWLIQSLNALNKYIRMQPFVTEMCTCVTQRWKYEYDIIRHSQIMCILWDTVCNNTMKPWMIRHFVWYVIDRSAYLFGWLLHGANCMLLCKFNFGCMVIICFYNKHFLIYMVIFIWKFFSSLLLYDISDFPVLYVTRGKVINKMTILDFFIA